MGVAANIIAKYIERYRWIAWFGLIVIVYVAIKMIYEGWIDPNLGVGRYVYAMIGS
jgi:predicted tellurium resistance membrane protein TerC